MNLPNTISYLNEKEISLAYKLLGLRDHIIKTKNKSVELSIKGPKIGYQLGDGEKRLDPIDKLFSVWDYYTSNDLITNKRPNTIKEHLEHQDRFIFEKITAQKFFFPKSKLTEIPSLNGLVVWLSNPYDDSLTEELYPITGTFLLLVEASFDQGKFTSIVSGCSALQALSNVISGKPFYAIQGEEPLGRGSYIHPRKKLENIGAIYLQEQEIMTLYKGRYITNEQCFEKQKTEYRCNDLLGYPLFVS